MRSLLLFLFITPIISCSQTSNENSKMNNIYLINKTVTEWRKILTKQEFNILRESGTERAYSGEYNSFYERGIYICKACNSELYNSKYKFDSRSGWPSFDRSIKEKTLYDIDYKIGYPRSEIKCAKCGSHLGHMFNDGPKGTTGIRHCINSLALTFIPYNNE